MFQYHLKNIHLSVIADWQSQNINIQILKREKNLSKFRAAKVFELGCFPNTVFSYHLVMILRDTKVIHLIFKFRPTIFVPLISDVGKREYIIQLNFGKKYMFWFFFFCHFATFHVCWHAQWYKALLLQEWPLHGSVATFIGNMQIQCSIKILKDFKVKADFTAWSSTRPGLCLGLVFGFPPLTHQSSPSSVKK